MANFYDKFDNPDYANNYAPPATKNSTETDIFDDVKDVGVSIAKGVVAVPDTVVGLSDAVTSLVGLNETGRGIRDALANKDGAIGFRPREAMNMIDSAYSDGYKAKRKELEARKGFTNSAAYVLQNPTLAINAVAESLPSMAAGGVVGKAGAAGITRLAGRKLSDVGAAAIGEGLMTAGSQASNIQEETGGLTAGQAAASLATGVIGGGLGLLGGKAAQKMGLADPDTYIAAKLGGKSMVGEASTKAKLMSIPNAAVKGAIAEGLLEELPQSISETVIGNLATDKHWSEGLGQAAAMGIITGGLMGGAFGGVSGYADYKETKANPALGRTLTRDEHLANLNKPEQSEAVDAFNDEALRGFGQSPHQDTIDQTPIYQKLAEMGDTTPLSESRYQNMLSNVGLSDTAKPTFNAEDNLAILQAEEETAYEDAPMSPSESMGLSRSRGALEAAAADAVDSGAARSNDYYNPLSALDASNSNQSSLNAISNLQALSDEEQNGYGVSAQRSSENAAVKATQSAPVENKAEPLPQSGMAGTTIEPASNAPASIPVQGGKHYKGTNAPKAPILGSNKPVSSVSTESKPISTSTEQVKVENTPAKPARQSITSYASAADVQPVAPIERSKLSVGADKLPNGVKQQDVSRTRELLDTEQKKTFNALPYSLQKDMEIYAEYVSDHIRRKDAGLPDARSHYPSFVNQSINRVAVASKADKAVNDIATSLQRKTYGHRSIHGWDNPLPMGKDADITDFQPVKLSNSEVDAMKKRIGAQEIIKPSSSEYFTTAEEAQRAADVYGFKAHKPHKTENGFVLKRVGSPVDGNQVETKGKVQTGIIAESKVKDSVAPAPKAKIATKATAKVDTVTDAGKKADSEKFRKAMNAAIKKKLSESKDSEVKARLAELEKEAAQKTRDDFLSGYSRVVDDIQAYLKSKHNKDWKREPEKENAYDNNRLAMTAIGFRADKDKGKGKAEFLDALGKFWDSRNSKEKRDRNTQSGDNKAGKANWWDKQPDNVEVRLIGKSRGKDYVKTTRNEDGTFDVDVVNAGVMTSKHGLKKGDVAPFVNGLIQTMGGNPKPLKLAKPFADKESAKSEEDRKYSQSAMKSIEANIRRGKAAMNRVILNKADVKRAMYRNDIGWVDFVWGDDGTARKNSKGEPVGKGISHIIEARQRKDGMTYSQAVKMLSENIVETIAKGAVVNRWERNDGKAVSLRIDYNGCRAALVKNAGSNSWLVTAFELYQDDSKSAGSVDTVKDTHETPTLTRRSVGASDTVSNVPNIKALRNAVKRAVGAINMQHIDIISYADAAKADPKNAEDLLTAQGWYDTKAKRVTLIADNMDERTAMFTAWHELGHRKIDVSGFHNWKNLFKNAYQGNALLRDIAHEIRRQREGMNDPAASNPYIAVEEAAVELYSAWKNSDYAMIEEKYGVKVPVEMRGNRLQRFFAKLINAAKAVIKRNLHVDNFSNDQLIELLRRIDNSMPSARVSVGGDVAGYGKRFNLSEDVQSAFAKAVDAVAEGKAVKGYVNLGSTPDALRVIGLPSVKVTMHGSVFAKVMGGKHNLTKETMKQLPAQLNSPVAVMGSSFTATKQGGYVVLTELVESEKGNDKPVIAALHLKQDANGIQLLNIASIYGRRLSQLQSGLDKELKYWNKDKGLKFVKAFGLQLPAYASTDSALAKHNIKTDADLAQVQQNRFSRDSDGHKADYEKAKADGKTELTFRQWQQVRTPEFKAWFGDWENDPANASKVINPRTGEPLVVYHGTNAEFYSFDINKVSNTIHGLGHYFSDDESVATGYGSRIVGAYLNIGRILSADEITLTSSELSHILNNDEILWDFGDISKNRQKVLYSVLGNLMSLNSDVEIVDYISVASGNDAAIGVFRDFMSAGFKHSVPDGSNFYIPLNPNQIKSATDNTGAFDASNNDIRFSRKAVTRAKYEQRIDELFAGAKPNFNGVRVLDRADVLDMLGLGNMPVNLVESKVVAGKTNHSLITADVWKKIPDWVDTPAMVFDSDTVEGRLVFIAPEKVSGKPVRIILEAGANGVDAHVLVNAYDANKSMPWQRWVRDGLARYMDTTKAQSVLEDSALSRVPSSNRPSRGLTDSQAFRSQLNGLLKQSAGHRKILTEKNLQGYVKKNPLDDAPLKFSRSSKKMKKSAALAHNISGAINAVVNLDRNAFARAKGSLDGKRIDFMGIGLQALGRRQITDIYSGMIPELENYDMLSDRFAADGNMAAVSADKVVTDWGKLKDADALADLMHDATLAKVDADTLFREIPEKQLNAIQAVLENADNKLDSLKNELIELTSKTRELKKAFTEAKNNNKTAEKNFQKAQDAVMRIKSDIKTLTENIGKEKDAAKKAALRKKISTLKESLEKTQQALPTLEAEAMATFRAVKNADGDLMAALYRKDTELPKEIKTARAEVRDIEKREVELKERLDKSADLFVRFNGLSKEAQAVYRKARDDYKAHFEQVKQAMQERMQRMGISDDATSSIDLKFENALAGVYFPLSRFGKYVVAVKNDDGKVISISRAETMGEAEAVRRSFMERFPASKGFDVGRVMLDKEYSSMRDSVGRGFMKELFDALENMNFSTQQFADIEDTLSQLYLNSVPDLSWAKHGIHRKGTAGYSDDARRAYAQNMFHGASYLAKLRYGDLMEQSLQDMQKQVDAKAKEDKSYKQPEAQRVVDEMVKRHEAVMNPKRNKVSTTLTSFGFLYYMGLSPASAAVNLSQTALVAYPVMAAKWGAVKAVKALLAASKQAASKKGGYNNIRETLTDDEKAAFDKAVSYGVIDVSQAHDLAGIAQGEDTGVLWKTRRIMQAASWLFHQAELFNRQVTFIAAYRLAKAQHGDSDKAFAEAKKATYDGHFDYSAQNRPRFMQGNVAKVVFLFKQYSQNMVYTISRNAYLAAKGDKQARKTFAGLMVAHAMAAGVLGLPAVSALLSAASWLGSDDDEPWDAEAALRNQLSAIFGKKGSEVISKGVSRLTPLDISGRVGLNNLIFPDIQEGLQGARAAESFAAAMMGPVLGIGINFTKGFNLWADGDYKKGLEQMLPVSIRNPLKSYRFAVDGHVDRSGIVVKDDFGVVEITGQALGFSPSDLRLKMEGKGSVYRADRSVQERRTELMQRVAKAVMDKDREKAKEIQREIAEFNRKNPNRRITPQHISSSVKARKKRINESQNGLYLPNNRRQYMESGAYAFDN